MTKPLLPLPIDEVIPAFCHAIGQNSSLVLQAPPGAGKTTRIPPTLSRLLGDASGQVMMVQPRRLAARTAAYRIAEENEWELGREVGYQVRFERKGDHKSRIMVVTEGVLLRKLQADPCLSGIAAVVLDEFHERRLDTDLLLGMIRRVQQTVRPELKLIVMSATLDAEPIANFLQPSTLITSQGRSFPVEIRYTKSPERGEWLELLARTTLHAVDKHPGDMLVFLPGVGEIHRLEQILARQLDRADFDILPLYADLSIEQQDRALNASRKRKLVLATNVAETSITIDGIVTVIDSGLARVLRHDAEVGLDKLQLEPISQASSTQRAGRAGRTAPGICYRIWDEVAHRTRPLFTTPEVQAIDLASAVLQLICWGERDVLEFPWFEKPRVEAVAQAIRLLESLGAVQQGSITSLGEQMAALPVHPRLARMLVESQVLGGMHQAALAAAILSERDPFNRRFARGSGDGRKPPTRHGVRSNCDLMDRIEALEEYRRSGREEFDVGTLNPSAAKQVFRAADQLERQCHVGTKAISDPTATGSEWLGPALLAAFPDRLAKRRDAGKARGLMVGGRGVRISEESNVQDAELFLCLVVSGDYQGDSQVRIASAVRPEWLIGPSITENEELFFHPSQEQVVARKRRYWSDLLLHETPTAASDKEAVADLLYQSAVPAFDRLFPKEDEGVGGLVSRIRCLRRWMPELEIPEFDTERLKEILHNLCFGRRSFAELKSAPWREMIEAELAPEQNQALQKHAPERIVLPKGHRAKIVYEEDKPPVLAARIQDFFGWKDTPRIAAGRVRLQLHLLAPSQRCQQITEDLASFWENTYETVRKELKRRYPKHSWPEDPRKVDPSDLGGPGGKSRS
jgi:ATP-dependent helicase HrpB